MTSDRSYKIRLVQVTTVPVSLSFLKGHILFLKEHNFDLQAITSPGPEADDFRLKTRIPVISVPMKRRISPFKDVVALYRLWGLFRKLKPDIVHAHTPKAGLLATLAARLAGVRVIFLSIFGLPQMTRHGLSRELLNLASKIACWISDRVWADSPSMSEYLAKSGLCPLRKSFVLGSGSVAGVDAEYSFNPALQERSAGVGIRAKYYIPSSAIVLGYVGRIVGDKGMHELAQVWRILRNENEDLHLLIVGQFEEHDPLQEGVEALFRTDPRIHLTGHVGEVAAYYAAMDIYVMPSYREGFGITNIEAAAMCLPVVSTRIPGCVDSVQDGSTGTLVPPRDSPALAAALRRYVKDPKLRMSHGMAGRARALKTFRPKTIYEGLLGEYTKLWSTK